MVLPWCRYLSSVGGLNPSPVIILEPSISEFELDLLSYSDSLLGIREKR